MDDHADSAIFLPREAATARLGAALGAMLEPGDVILLHGDLGAGKSTLARATVQAATGAGIAAPSPTFTLVQSYEGRRCPILHVDLYRLSGAAETMELGLPADGSAALLIEWPDRLGALTPDDRLDLYLSIDPSGGRRLRWSASGPAGRRLAGGIAPVLRSPQDRALSKRDFLVAAGWGAATVVPLAGDASPRRYDRVHRPDQTAVLMDAAPETGEDVAMFAAMTGYLAGRGFSVPTILAEDIDAGFLLLEDLGDGLIARGPAPEPDLYEAAIDTLAALHAAPPPLSVTHDEYFRPLPAYGEAMLLREFDIALDWWAPLRRPLDADDRAEGMALFRAAMAPVSQARGTLVMRDYHAENLLWLPEREGVRRIGLLDYQGAHRGHAAYDLASILEDARRDMAPGLAAHLRARYVTATGVNQEEFELAFDALAAQRNLKILGLFARLKCRDGKGTYLHHLPRVWRHLMRDLSNPALAALRAWVLAHLPPPDADALARLSVAS